MALQEDPVVPPPERILSLLGLEKSSSAEELRIMICSRFRQPQQVQLADMLDAIPALSTVTLWFSHQFDPTDDVEHYLQDLIRMHHYIAAHDRQRPLRSTHLGTLESPAVTRQLLHFYASFADSKDRHLLTKIYQTLGLSRAITYCVVAKTMPFKFQKDFLDLFAEDLPKLREWIIWLDGLDHTAVDTSRGGDEMIDEPGYQSAVHFVSRAIREHCMLMWMELLQPLDTGKKLAVIDAIHKLLATSNDLSPATSTLKKLGRFYETTGISAAKLLDLDIAVRRELPLLLEEFPTMSLLTLFAKFNSYEMIQLVVKRGLPFFPKNDLLRMLDALAPADPKAVQVFVTNLFSFGRKKVDFLLLFLSFSTQNQLHFLNLMLATSNSSWNGEFNDNEEEINREDAAVHQSKGNFFLLKLFLYAQLSSPDGVIHKLSTLPSALAQQVVDVLDIHSAEDFIELGRGLETVELPCLEPFLRLFLAIPPDWRDALVCLVDDMPGAEALPLYSTLLNLHATSSLTSSDNNVTTVLQMLSSLDRKDKMLLCTDILDTRFEAQSDGNANVPSPIEIHVKILLHLCECELSRHKVLGLFRAIPFVEYDRLLYFLRTQRMPEQVSLTRLMLSMPREANCRLLAKLSVWSTEALDAFFQLLLMLAKVEYKMLAKLMGSQYVSAEQLESFVTVAVDMMNQASSRELVIFAAELPVQIRNLVFQMLVDRPEKGVLLRIISYSTRVPPELMHVLVALFHRMSWEIRSSFVEQLRALEDVDDVTSLAEVASHLQDNESLRLLVLLFNPLQVRIRVSLAALLLQLNVLERALVLTRLVEMPKTSVFFFITAMCHPNCEPVSPSFCRVISVVDSKYHTSLLRLLKSESLWFFLRLMAEHCDVNETNRNKTTELLNQVAHIVCRFTLDEHLMVLRAAIREALGDALPLSNVVGVLGLFSEVTNLLEFLRYVNGFAKYARTSLIFQVLSKYQQPVFIFEMCRILDLDDAVFALKRLDRMWQRRQEELDRAMDILARLFVGGRVDVKDDFCDLLVGFRGLSAELDNDKANGSAERVLTPRYVENTSNDEATSDIEDDDNCDRVLRLPRATPPSHQPVLLSRHLQRTRPDQAFPRKRTDRNAWWQDLDDSSFPLLPIDQQDATPSKLSRQQEQDSPVRASKTLPSVFVLTEQLHSVSMSESTKVSLNREVNDISAVETLPQVETAPMSKRCVQQQQVPDVLDSISRQSRAGTEIPHNNVTLNRSESASATLTFENETQWSQQKRARGVAPALGIPLEFHIGRDKGADFLQQQRARVYQEKGATCIRHARTQAAQAHVMEARVCRALGKRPITLHTVLSPLCRPDLHTVESAVVTLAKAAQLRDSRPQGFSTEAPVDEQIIARHPIPRVSPIPPATTLKSSVKPESEINCEPLAPW